jgi:hypothetical protein
VGIAMAGDLVPFSCNIADQLRQPLGQPAKHEERRLGIVLVEQLENPRGVGLDPQLQEVPLPVGNHLAQVGNLEPIFHVYGHHVDHGAYLLELGRRASTQYSWPISLIELTVNPAPSRSWQIASRR